MAFPIIPIIMAALQAGKGFLDHKAAQDQAGVRAGQSAADAVFAVGRDQGAAHQGGIAGIVRGMQAAQAQQPLTPQLGAMQDQKALQQMQSQKAPTPVAPAPIAPQTAPTSAPVNGAMQGPQPMQPQGNIDIQRILAMLQNGGMNG